LLELEEVLELDDEEPDPEDEWELVDDPEPPPELEDDDPELWLEPLWCDEPELLVLRVSPASPSPRCPPPSCFGGLCATGGSFGGSLGGCL
jgi:hypothetical protein